MEAMTTEEKLSEMERKVEEFRRLMNSDDPDTALKGFYPARRAFNALFPPPRRGCWGFWRDRSVSGERIFKAFYGKSEAENDRAMLSKDWNCGPVFFLEEK